MNMKELKKQLKTEIKRIKKLRYIYNINTANKYYIKNLTFIVTYISLYN